MFTPEQLNRIKAALEERTRATGGVRACPVCGQVAGYQFGEAPAVVELKSPGDPRLPPGQSLGMPLVAMVCNRCGNTQFINLMFLGLEDLAGVYRLPPGFGP